MAMSSSITFEFRSTATANMVNGGGFKTGASGTDYSLQDAAQWNLTTATTAAANAIILDASAAATMVGNVAHIISGTNFITGWYEIISVVAGVSITVDRNCTTAAGALGVINIGGALNVGGSLEYDFFMEISGTNAADGISVYFYNNNSTSSVVFTPSEIVFSGNTGGTLAPINIIGYKTTRGDNPTGNSRPTIAAGANTVSLGANFNIYNLQFTSTSAQGVRLLLNCQATNCKSTNNSTTTTRAAIYADTVTDILIFNCEAISYRGRAISLQVSTTGAVMYSYIHDSDTGYYTLSTGNTNHIIGNIFESCVTAAINIAAANTAQNLIIGNTLYGSENTTGIGINLTAGCTDTKVLNNIICGFVTGVSHGTAGQTVGYDDYNDYFNNDTDVSNWTKGSNDQAINPAFTSVAQVTGTTGTYAVKTLTDAAANFNNVVDNQDFVYIISGTGMTAGQYLITAHTQTTITTDLDAGENVAGNVVYQVTTGRNFAIGGAI